MPSDNQKKPLFVGQEQAPAERYVRHTFPNSSILLYGSYEYLTRKLRLQFKNGALYAYVGVEPEVWDEFRTAPSAGVYFSTFIKGKYHTVKLAPPTASTPAS